MNEVEFGGICLKSLSVISIRLKKIEPTQTKRLPMLFIHALNRMNVLIQNNLTESNILLFSMFDGNQMTSVALFM